MKHPLSIKSKLTLWYLLFLVIVLLFFNGFSYLILNQNLHHVNNSAINVTTLNVKEPGISPSDISSNSRSDSSNQSYSSLLTYVISEDQLRGIQSGTITPISLNIDQNEISIDQNSFITPEMKGSQQIWLYYRASVTQSGYYEILIFTQPQAEIVSSFEAYKEILIIVIPITIILAGILGYFFVKRMLKPVENITKIAQEIQDKDLNRRIEIRNDDELGNLSATLNRAFEHLQKSMERQRQFTNDASHELQTPLAIVQGEASLALTQERTKEEYQKALESISDEISRVYSTVSKLLTLARADSGAEPLNLEKTNLKELLGDIAADIKVLSEKKGINFQADLPEAIFVNGDGMKLRELFLNILGNAIKYTPASGNITLSLVKYDETAKIAVKDTGIGISEEHLPHIFERFYRANKTHSDNDEGSGLGLAICQHIAEVHGGKIEVESQVGKGSIFTVILPLMKD
jgi:heavy metal sensor kinase